MAVPLGSKPKRTLKDIDKWLTAEEIYKLITGRVWPYKQTPDFYRTRDKALMALYFSTGCRNNEVLLLKKSQFTVKKDFVTIRGMYISKRSKKMIARHGAKITTRVPIHLPQLDTLSEEKFAKALEPFTQLIIDHLKLLEPRSKDAKLFNFAERRSHQVISFVTGKWVHWFRAMSENFYGKLFGDAVRLAKFMGIINVQSVMPYVPFDEKAYLKDLQEKT